MDRLVRSSIFPDQLVRSFLAPPMPCHRDPGCKFPGAGGIENCDLATPVPRQAGRVGGIWPSCPFLILDVWLLYIWPGIPIAYRYTT